MLVSRQPQNGCHATDRDCLRIIANAARASHPVSGFTHRFYRYPARFSPHFVGEVITALSEPGDVVLDPFVGGGTTIVEAMARGRRAIGCDVSALAVFIARAKTTPLRAREQDAIAKWSMETVPRIRYSDSLAQSGLESDARIRNLNLARARPIRKFIALCIDTLEQLPTTNAKNFGRCALLNAGQWALNGKRNAPTLSELRSKVPQMTFEMMEGTRQLMHAANANSLANRRPIVINAPCASLPNRAPFVSGQKVDLVVTSPPYPGVHVLYHRWQVDGRKETPAPFWVADCFDGKGPGVYNMGTRGVGGEEFYYAELKRSMSALRSVCRDAAYIVQLVAFAKPRSQLKKYLAVMGESGYREVTHVAPQQTGRRIWRDVPQRAWHANSLGRTNASKEILLIHQAV